MSQLYRDEKGQWRLPIKHRMGRRRHAWHYNWAGLYMITLTLADRSKPLLGRLVGEPDMARIALSPLGEAIAQLWQGISDFHPEVEPLDFQVMPDHFHGILRVTRQMARPLGAVVGGFKAGCTKAYRALETATCRSQREQAQVGENCTLPGAARAPVGEPSPYMARRKRGEPAPHAGACGSLWAPGYHDSIAFNDERLARMIAYIKDNPRRLALKRKHRDLFRVVQNLPFHGGALSALGNLFLLDSPQFVQVQCSRSATAADIEALKRRVLSRAGCRAIDGAALWGARGLPRRFAPRNDEQNDGAAQGAVVVSPCISPGEKEVARAAFEAGVRLIVLKNMGFSPFAKPSGAYFDACAEGRLLMLAPCAWPYSPQKKPLTRIEACVLNRIAQLICGEDAAPINYKGMQPAEIDQEVRRALACESKH